MPAQLKKASLIQNLSSENKVILENFFSLSFLQIANYILPLITLPYLVRVLGVANFGLIAFAQSFTQYFIMFTDYGFVLTATREISIYKGNLDKISEVFSSVMMVKFIIAAFSFIILCFIVFFIPKFTANIMVYFLFFGVVIGNILFPTWLFQGMENMKFITIINVLIKMIFTVAVFIFIKTKSDFVYLPLLYSLGYLSGGILSLYIVFRYLGVYFKMPNYENILHYLKDGWQVFVSMIFINLCGATNTLILGFFASNTIVGYYAAAEKLIITVASLFNPIYQAVYPHIAQVAHLSADKAIIKIRKLIAILMPIFIAFFLSFFLFAKQIVLLIFGHEFTPAILLVRIMSPLLVLIPISYVMANLTLIPLKLDRYFLRAYLGGAFLNLALLFFTISILRQGAMGAAMANLTTQLILTTGFYLILRMRDIKIIHYSF